jgi:hypothetical protein
VDELQGGREKQRASQLYSPARLEQVGVSSRSGGTSEVAYSSDDDDHDCGGGL